MRLFWDCGHAQWRQTLVSSEASDETGFPRASWWVRVKEVRSTVNGWEALGKAVSAEPKPRSGTKYSQFKSLNLTVYCPILTDLDRWKRAEEINQADLTLTAI